jgi:hypothetical protein
MPPDIAKRNRPGGQSQAASDDSISLDSVDPRDDIARHVDGTFVLVVKVTAGKYRRRCYLTVMAAEKAAQRATDRGETATVYLAELRPLWKLRGGAA